MTNVAPPYREEFQSEGTAIFDALRPSLDLDGLCMRAKTFGLSSCGSAMASKMQGRCSVGSCLSYPWQTHIQGEKSSAEGEKLRILRARGDPLCDISRGPKIEILWTKSSKRTKTHPNPTGKVTLLVWYVLGCKKPQKYLDTSV